MKKFWDESRLADKILMGLLALVIIGGLVTIIYANIANESAISELGPQVEAIETPISITVLEAREIAIELVGGGTVNELNLNTDESTFDIIVYHNQEFQVTLDATTGELIRLESLTTTSNEVESPDIDSLQAIESSENLTSDQAVDLAKEHLAIIGITDAILVYSETDLEEGIPVWSIEFRHNGRDLEFYVGKATGNFLKSPTAQNNNNSASPTQQRHKIDRKSTRLNSSH